MRRPNKWGRAARQRRRDEAQARQERYDAQFPTPEAKKAEQRRRRGLTNGGDS